jgi:hypothetical protein
LPAAAWASPDRQRAIAVEVAIALVPPHHALGHLEGLGAAAERDERAGIVAVAEDGVGAGRPVRAHVPGEGLEAGDGLRMAVAEEVGRDDDLAQRPHASVAGCKSLHLADAQERGAELARLVVPALRERDVGHHAACGEGMAMERPVQVEGLRQRDARLDLRLGVAPARDEVAREGDARRDVRGPVDRRRTGRQSRPSLRLQRLVGRYRLAKLSLGFLPLALRLEEVGLGDEDDRVPCWRVWPAREAGMDLARARDVLARGVHVADVARVAPGLRRRAHGEEHPVRVAARVTAPLEELRRLGIERDRRAPVSQLRFRKGLQVDQVRQRRQVGLPRDGDRRSRGVPRVAEAPFRERRAGSARRLGGLRRGG